MRVSPLRDRRVIASLAVAVMGVAAAVAVAQEDFSAFRDASVEGTSRSLREYLRHHPRGFQAVKATRQLDDALFAEASKAGTSIALRRYLRDAPHGTHRAAVRPLLDDAVFKAAVAQGSIGALEAYREEFPEGAHANEIAGVAAGVTKEVFEDYDRRATARRADRRATRAMRLVSEYLQGGGQRELQVIPSGRNRSSAAAKHNLRLDEHAITSHIKTAFDEIFLNDILSVAMTSAPDPAKLQLHVDYSLRDTDDRFTLENSKREYRGIRFVWEMRLVIPKAAGAAYSFSFRTDPADEFSVPYTTFGGANVGPSETQVYDAMIQTAFGDFTTEFLKRFGLEVEEKTG